MMTPRLTVIGAGPGDAELITLKGVRALECADVVLYDDLANVALLEHAPVDALRMYVGKRSGQSSFSQEEINGLIVRLARKRGHVVRLKGGDPFVFGRGHEEIEYAACHGVETAYIPGVSSSIAAAGSAGIPVTRRGVSESFWVITGTTRDGELSDDLRLAAQSKATVVVLMGMSRLKDICALYKQFGRGHMPMAVVQHATTEHEKTAIGQVWEMPALAAEKRLSTPAVIIIGEVVGLHPRYVIEYLRQNQLAM